MGYGGGVRPDPEIERLEADLRRSRFEPWDVEKLLADRHRAKIEALEKPKSTWAYRWQVVREVTDPAFLFIGWVASLVFVTVWALTGEYPFQPNRMPGGIELHSGQAAPQLPQRYQTDPRDGENPAQSPALPEGG